MQSIFGAVLQGLRALQVEVQVGLDTGVGFKIVGLGKPEVKESEARLKHAFSNSGFEWPQAKITVNLAPADVVKQGSLLDLSIALAIMAASGQIKAGYDGGRVLAFGELGLDGKLRPAKGALAIGRAVPPGSVIIGPIGTEYELALLPLVANTALHKEYTALVVSTLNEAAKAFAGTGGTLATSLVKGFKRARPDSYIDFKAIKGQARAKRALEVAAAGGHNVLLIGPPGEGKSLLAKATPTILPNLNAGEQLDLTWIYSSGGKLTEPNEIVMHRPFRAVHHTASINSIVGGGSSFPMPGELTYAHLGVLFLDELPEFPKKLLEALRQPLEDGVVHLTRVNGAATYPCDVTLLAAMNPCPCGYDGERQCTNCNTLVNPIDKECQECSGVSFKSRCKCAATEVKSYRKRLSGPILDRIDIKLRVSPLSADERLAKADGEPSEKVRARVNAARLVQQKRFSGTAIKMNAAIPGGSVEKYCQLDLSGKKAIEDIAHKIPDLSTRGHDKLLKLARTVADLHQSPLIYRKHLREAAELGDYDGVREFLDASDSSGTEYCTGCGGSYQRGDRFCRGCGTGLSTVVAETV